MAQINDFNSMHTRLRPIFTGLLLLLVQVLFAQNRLDSFVQVMHLAGGTRFATADNLGNVYRITASNAVEKYAPGGRLLSQFSSNRLGQASSIDVSNPMKTLIWYADFKTVLFLDRSLTALGELNLLQAGFPEVRTVASARDGNMWIYDEALFRLRKVTPAGEQLFESVNLGQLYAFRLAITWMEESDTRLFAAEAQNGIMVFDAFAQPVGNVLADQHPAVFDVDREVVQYADSTQWNAVWLTPPQAAHLPLPKAPDVAGKWFAFEHKLFFCGENGLWVFVVGSEK
jgi:hypothetical protein